MPDLFDIVKLDFLRRSWTTGLEVAAPDEGVYRGDDVEAVVTVSRPRGLGTIEVGLVCTETYDVEDTSWDQESRRRVTRRMTAEALAHEEWTPVESTEGVQTFRFEVPAGAPFSYKGRCLSFDWEVVARGKKKHRLDAQARQKITVYP
jgi:hypothetical protein